MAYLIGVAGGTGAGKGTVVRALVERFGGVSIDLDSYYHDHSGLALEKRRLLNYDEPAAIDVALLLDHLRQLTMGVAVAKPKYSFQSHTRVGAEMVSPARLILVEGLFALWWEELRALLDVRVFVDAPPGVRLARRVRRDVSERGRTVESVMAQYASTVKAMHERYVEPTRVYADLVVENDGLVQGCVEAVVAAIRRLRPAGSPAETGGSAMSGTAEP
jgi:uridine kinase